MGFSLGSLGSVFGGVKNAFNKTLNPLSDENIFRKGPAAVAFPGQNPNVQKASAVAGSGQLALGGTGTAAAATAGSAGASAIPSSLATAATILSAGTNLVSAFMGRRQATGPENGPEVTPVAQMPSFDSPTAEALRRATIMDLSRRRGRASTFLTSGDAGISDRLGS